MCYKIKNNMHVNITPKQNDHKICAYLCNTKRNLASDAINTTQKTSPDKNNQNHTNQSTEPRGTKNIRARGRPHPSIEQLNHNNEQYNGMITPHW